MLKIIYLKLFVILLAVCCGAAQGAEKLPVIASFSILGDIVQRVGGERIAVRALVGPDADAHVYQPTPADAKHLAEAKLVVVNGLGFEGWIDRLIKSSGYKGRVVTASSGVAALKAEQESHHGGHDHGDEIDPHAWHDIANVEKYVDNIAAALIAADPEGKTAYMANAAAYKADLASIDAEVRKRFAALPKQRLKIVTTHDAFGYFGRAYGVTFIAPVGVSTDAEASAADIGRIIRQIRRERIPAVFLESVSDSRLLERIRQESGARIGGTLYADALSKTDGPATTYIEMMRHNAQTLAHALAP